MYPAVPGHEVIGKVVAVGPAAKGLQPGQRVGIGWTAGSCMHCRQCLSGDQHMCQKYGCGVTAFTSTESKFEEAHEFEAHITNRFSCGHETMLNSATRHQITPQTEHLPMNRINDAFERLEAGKARYRIVLDADF